LVLIDTPGFDDTDHLSKTNKAILKDIEKALKNLYVLLTSSHFHKIHTQQRGSGLSSSKGRVSGIFYLHRNTEKHMSAAASTIMEQLGGGEEILQKVILITTTPLQLTDVRYAESEPHEEESTFNNNKSGGLMSWRFTQTPECAQQVINEIIRIGCLEQSGKTRQRR
jgi:hypothetical protein